MLDQNQLNYSKMMGKEYINELAKTTIYTVDQIDHFQRRFNLSEQETKSVCNVAINCGITFNHLESLLLALALSDLNEL